VYYIVSRNYGVLEVEEYERFLDAVLCAGYEGSPVFATRESAELYIKQNTKEESV